MSEDKPLTGIKKRQQISDTRKQVFIWVAAASAVVMVCLVIGFNLYQRIAYQTKVNSELAKTTKTLDNDVQAIDSVIENVNALKSNKKLNLTNLKSDDSTVFQVVIDALPTEDDSVALSASLQDRILAQAGVTIDQISVESTSTTTTDDDEDSSSSSSIDFPTAQPITFRFTIIGSYDAITDALKDIERSIRPIIINQLSIEGSDDRLEATVQATTYYSSSVKFTTSTKEVSYEEK